MSQTGASSRCWTASGCSAASIVLHIRIATLYSGVSAGLAIYICILALQVHIRILRVGRLRLHIDLSLIVPVNVFSAFVAVLKVDLPVRVAVLGIFEHFLIAVLRKSR